VGELEAAPSGKLLYLLLTDTADADGVIIISQKKISTALGISKGTVSRNLRKLKKCGYIDIVPTFHDDGGRAANKYYVFD
jgi:DNA-binding MarR family transcriptional regulator